MWTPDRPVTGRRAHAWFAGRLATDVVEVTDNPGALDRPGFWVVVGTFEGTWTCVRFATVRAPGRVSVGGPDGSWPAMPASAWRSSVTQAQYQDGVRAVRDLIAAGEVYQVNLCRMLSAPLPRTADLTALSHQIARGNPAPRSARVFVPQAGLDLVSASPELFLRRVGQTVSSAPIKGTGRRVDDLTAKDVAENIMIVDLVRNDLGRVCLPGSVQVDDVLSVERHPGLVHVVSTVRGRLRPATTWPEILAATFPPGSVSGAPKSTALQAISSLEPVARGPYCGAIGWVDAENDRAELAVGIRTFVHTGGHLHFGTGAGITWGSDPEREWQETELKAQRLLGLTAVDGRTA